jgi:hypothetical protein
MARSAQWEISISPFAELENHASRYSKMVLVSGIGEVSNKDIVISHEVVELPYS